MHQKEELLIESSQKWKAASMKHSCVSWIIRKEPVPEWMGGLALQLWLISELRIHSVLSMLPVSGYANLSRSPKIPITLWFTLQRHSLRRDGNFSRQLLQSKPHLRKPVPSNQWAQQLCTSTSHHKWCLGVAWTAQPVWRWRTEPTWHNLPINQGWI